jgi:5-hydroxyisourate hydrolase-like protein (transthyretin family)
MPIFENGVVKFLTEDKSPQRIHHTHHQKPGRLDLILVENATMDGGGYTIQNNRIKKSTLNQAAIAQKTSKK